MGIKEVIEPPIRAPHNHDSAPHVRHRGLGAHVAVQPKAAARRHRGPSKRVGRLYEAVHFGAALTLKSLTYTDACGEFQGSFQERTASARKSCDGHLCKIRRHASRDISRMKATIELHESSNTHKRASASYHRWRLSIESAEATCVRSPARVESFEWRAAATRGWVPQEFAP